MVYRRLKIASFISVLCASASAVGNSPASVWISSEYQPNAAQWFTDPWSDKEIPYQLSEQPALEWQKGASQEPDYGVTVDAAQTYQTVLGVGSSLEHATVYNIRKNKTPQEQYEVLRALIHPTDGIGMNLFRITIGTSDFSNGTMASPKPAPADGWYSFQDTPQSKVSLERHESLGIIDTLKMAIKVGEDSNNPVRFVASPWSPPAWMREGNSMVRGGAIKESALDAWADYMRKTVEAYQQAGIPIYALTLQNERAFEPEAYPGMKISGALERKMLEKLYENFHNIGGKFGEEISIKLWTLDHNFVYADEAIAQIDALKKAGKSNYLDGVAFHHYDGDSSAMAKVHHAHPDKDVIFTEGSVWGIGGGNPNRGLQSVIRHFQHWSTAYIGWVTMLNQDVELANNSPYDALGKVGPTLLIQEKGTSKQWYRTPEYYLIGQLSRFIKRGAVRIGSQADALDGVYQVAFKNPDKSIVVILSNANNAPVSAGVNANGQSVTTDIPANSLITLRWQPDAM
ncbi:hypothetical protein CA267_011530 [Alteromonas pelagimontana]|uniref:Glycosyl hydrolase n=1 Tax=Alteromonas pelagimontana TaxID=1858656 RepID=A0A6M4ME32_9ALTE|nr:glycoside hydrolase family 30 beta sandwich domain-containing protein [Alteromonas pelagimontana]QJR81363.1 hypothetical protein CA267_011530 [Alteromonas pelagimontana]